ncbi:ABC transporter permease [Faunimonas pinastri]|uniref:ABC transporter permease n=1 Tax=Faunimonas pinastri TaxID=1855383 RepID=UPI000B85EA31|nr:ABC transporter permease [Faunimonas pinastri]
MLSPVLRRLLVFAATLLAASLAIFIVMDVLPGDPAAIMLGTSARPDTLAAMHHQLGLDRPATVRYLSWLGGMLRGDFGTSITYGVPVSRLFADRLALTLPLALLAVVGSTLVALGLGMAAVARLGRATDHAVAVFSQLGIAVPDFWLGLILILCFATGLHWFSAIGFPGWSGGFFPALKALLLPAVALAVPQAAVLSRVTRAALLEVTHQDFVRTARAKGLRGSTIMLRHVLPNGLVPVLTIVGLQFSFLIAGAVLVENVFALPGLGRLVYQALAQRDLVVIRSVTMLFAAFVMLVNLAVDLAGLLLDPRLRAAR